MGLRSRLKNRLTGLLGAPAAPEPAPAPRAATPGPKAATPGPKAATPAPTAVQPAAAATTRPAASLPPAPPRPIPPPPPDKVADDKKREARLKAKKAVLQFLIKQGGTSNMKEMHDFSERRYFIAHKAFSDLMEEYLAEDLIQFDQETYVATLTDGGRHFVEAATHIKTRE